MRLMASVCFLTCLFPSTHAFAQGDNERIEQLEQQVGELEQDRENGIQFGGAARFQYVLTDYDDGQQNRGGDLQFDVFRLNFDGQMNDLILSAEYRWFEYMDALRHAYFGYNFTDEWQGQVGIVIQPFGVMPYNSHSYFFSSAFYVGLEDNPGSGLRLLRRSEHWDLDLAFILNDELGGVTGSMRSLADRYNYNVVSIRLPGEDIYDDPDYVATENNTLMARVAHKWHLNDDSIFELGVSGQFGGLHDGRYSVGDRTTLGVHGVYETGRWEFHAQYATYEYDVERDNEGVVVGAYAYFDTIPTSADIITGNIAYNLPFEWGPVQHLQFYNNHSVITNKRGFSEDTWMNVTGVAVTAGGMYTYVDFVMAQNQPFVNGSIAGESTRTNSRFNINFGYYF